MNLARIAVSTIGFVVGATISTIVAPTSRNTQQISADPRATIPSGNPTLPQSSPQAPSKMKILHLMDINLESNDDILLITDASLDEKRTGEISTLPSGTLQRWIEVDYLSAIPWLLRHASSLPANSIHGLIGTDEVLNNPRMLKVLFDNRESMDSSMELYVNTAILEQAIDGDLSNLRLTETEKSALMQKRSYREVLKTLIRSQDAPLGVRSRALDGIEKGDRKEFIEECNAIWDLLPAEEKAQNLSRLMQCYIRGDLAFDDFRGRFADAWLASGSRPNFRASAALLSMAQLNGSEVALQTLASVTAMQDFNYGTVAHDIFEIVRIDPGASSEWLNHQAPGAFKDSVIEALVSTLKDDPAANLAWVNQISDPAKQKAVQAKFRK